MFGDLRSTEATPSNLGRDMASPNVRANAQKTMSVEQRSVDLRVEDAAIVTALCRGSDLEQRSGGASSEKDWRRARRFTVCDGRLSP